MIRRLKHRIMSWIGSIKSIQTPFGGVSWDCVPASDLRVKLVRTNRHHRFVIENKGKAPAYNVNLDFVLQEGQRNPLVKNDCDLKLPIRELVPGSRIELMAALTLGSPITFTVKLRWEENGENKECTQNVHPLLEK